LPFPGRNRLCGETIQCKWLDANCPVYAFILHDLVLEVRESESERVSSNYEESEDFILEVTFTISSASLESQFNSIASP